MFSRTQSAIFIEGNGELCRGVPEFQLPQCKSKISKKKNLTLTMKLIISILFGFLAATFVLLPLLFSYLRKKKKGNTPSDSINFLLNASYQGVLDATNGFSSTNLIGVGNFGFVYKGILDHDRQTVALSRCCYHDRQTVAIMIDKQLWHYWSILVSIFNASNLETLQFNGNKLNGKVHSLEKLNRISKLFIQFNNLGNGEENDLNFLCSLINATYLTNLYISKSWNVAFIVTTLQLSYIIAMSQSFFFFFFLGLLFTHSL